MKEQEHIPILVDHLKMAMERIASDQKASVKKVMMVIEDYTGYNDLDPSVKNHVRMTVLAQFAGLYNKFVGLLSEIDPKYQCRRLEKKYSVQMKASSSIGGNKE